ncbi:hypothetical protein [Christiangramia sp. OXR-203]|uniref:WapI family immunity protein n=1 Tax=Christiangramia sp. OXR-203 TaxID=3100176 RepID=UPI002AC96FEB|nr:hypothetical protein [Christiangramia sp. OXR-203]WPY97632.1 hypothetical protein T8I65_10645 [Christiangramia sp. OXR-203]
MSTKEDKSNSLLIKNDENSIRINVIGRAYPSADNDWDKSWLKSELEFKLGSFYGNIKTKVQIDDFTNFAKELEEQYETLLTNSSFEPREENIRLNFTNQYGGFIEVRFIIMDQVGLGHELTGEFIIDQSYLPNILDQIRSIIQCDGKSKK